MIKREKTYHKILLVFSALFFIWIATAGSNQPLSSVTKKDLPVCEISPCFHQEPFILESYFGNETIITPINYLLKNNYFGSELQIFVNRTSAIFSGDNIFITPGTNPPRKI